MNLFGHKTLYLFRHALATHNPAGYGDQILTANILPEGIPPIQRLAENLKQYPVEYAIRSEVKRCQQTAEIVSGITSLEFDHDPRLNEFYNESFEAFRDRTQDFLDDLTKQPAQQIVICTHGAVISAFKGFLLEDGVQNFEQLDNVNNYPSTGVLWIIKDGKLEASDFN